LRGRLWRPHFPSKVINPHINFLGRGKHGD
jgi:hypothetical protein